MSWSPIARLPVRNPARATAAAVRVSMAKAGRFPGRLTVTMRRDLLPEFTILDAKAVAVLAGAGEHRGMLRIVPGKTHSLALLGGKHDANAQIRIIRLPMPAGLVPADHPATAVEFDYGDDWLELTLPLWAQAQEAAPARTPGFVSVSDRTPDPRPDPRRARA